MGNKFSKKKVPSCSEDGRQTKGVEPVPPSKSTPSAVSVPTNVTPTPDSKPSESPALDQASKDAKQPKSLSVTAPLSANEAEAAPGTPSGSLAAGSPSMRRGPKKVDVLGQQTDGSQLAAALPAAVTIPDTAQHLVPLLGQSLVRNLYSPDWKTRKGGLAVLARNLDSAKWREQHGVTTGWNAATHLLDMAIKDKVAPLFHAAIELFCAAVATYAPLLWAEPAALRTPLEPILATLMHRAGNLNPKIQEASIHALVTLAGAPGLGMDFLAPHALAPIPAKKSGGAAANTAMAGRLELLLSLLNAQAQAAAMGGGKAQALALPSVQVLAFVRPALEVADDKVRAAAIRVLGELYRDARMHGDTLAPEKHLGPIKPALLQVLHRRFAEVDAELQLGGASSAAGGPAAAADSVAASAAARSALPPIGGLARGGGPLAPLQVIGSRPAASPSADYGSTSSSTSMHAPGDASPAFPPGKPPRTPLRTPGSPGAAGSRLGSPARGGGLPRGTSPARSSRPLGDGSVGVAAAAMPGSLLSEEELVTQKSGLGAKGSVTGAAGGGGVGRSLGTHGSLRAAGSRGSSRAGSQQSSRGSDVTERILDEEEEQLIEYILNKEAKE